MVDSFREGEGSAVSWVRPGLAGLALGMIAMAGGSLIVYDSDGLLTAAAGLVSTVMAALLVGMWAGAPGADAEELPARERWMAAALATAVAGAFATVWTLYPPLAESGFGGVLGLLVLIALPVYALGMLLPVLLAGAEQAEAGEGWGAIGGVVAGALGGLGVGALLAAVVLVPWLSPGALLLGLSVAMLAPALLPEAVLPEPEEDVLHLAATPFGVVRVTEVTFPGERQPERRLYLDEEQESGELVRSGAPTLPYVAAAEAWLAGGTPPGSGYLFLGGGAYTLPRRVAERDPRGRITVVELNREVTRAAYRFFGVRKEHGIATVPGDARAYLERGPAGEFDRVYMDVYGGQETIPFPLVTVEAFTALRRRLRPGGVAGVNAIGVAEGPESVRVWSVVHTFAEVFPAVAVYSHLGADYPDRQNFLLLGAADPDARFPDRIGLFARWPLGDGWPAPEGTTVLRDG